MMSGEYEGSMMPPTRGHDLKPPGHNLVDDEDWMPPTRGHDLKRDARP